MARLIENLSLYLISLNIIIINKNLSHLQSIQNLGIYFNYSVKIINKVLGKLKMSCSCFYFPLRQIQRA